MRNLKVIHYLLIGFIGLLSCKDSPKKIIKTEPIIFKKEGALQIFDSKKDSLLATIDIEIADSDYETQTGLMYRSAMKLSEGMLFIFPDEAMHSFYMKNTEIPLDLIFIKKNHSIANIQENAQPYDESSVSSKVPVQYVLEVNAGLVEKWGVEVGDSIAFEKL
ncbi:DUF192 domain-containing protein [Pareuzebyella sediminis]|uniref:DUF192 domain-containing protein n=1 Tax=Pareuzebyella sediminis TaxID=2607998 RepID=UPI0011EFA2C2|nr:DUF192 domain-containing protein [Pareuzebyella sediminis]